ncbi:MAG: NUDIX domain-containing protein [Dehalococcoidia bacterium]|nr:NUDIX domain-containing protein [Dehalococcoidia bacterium]
MPEPRSVPRRLSAGVILVDREGRVLLQHRDDDPAIMYPGHWGITGGAGMPGETPEEIARREVHEETGIELGEIEAFRAYYTPAAAASGRGRVAAAKRSDYELYLYHAPCETPAEAMACGEGIELRFFAPHELPGLPVAYNHREVLTDFFASAAYRRYLRGIPFGIAGDDGERGIEPIEHFRSALAAGDHWFEALMQAIALWERPQETVDGRAYRYLVGGEAFDWLLLAERLIEDADGRIPAAEAERLLFEARAPRELDDDALHDLIGTSKHRAHLNYLYGVTVEEALQYAVELDLSKEHRSVHIDDGDAPARDPVFERIYDRGRAELLREFRDEQARPHAAAISLPALREFLYWLFKYRVAHQEPARVASDTRKALAQLSRMEDAVRRSGRRERAPQPPPAFDDGAVS